MYPTIIVNVSINHEHELLVVVSHTGYWRVPNKDNGKYAFWKNTSANLTRIKNKYKDCILIPTQPLVQFERIGDGTWRWVAYPQIDMQVTASTVLFSYELQDNAITFVATDVAGKYMKERALGNEHK